MNVIANIWNTVTFHSAIGAALAGGIAIIGAALIYRSAR